jgi:hypothetical protein
VTKISAVIPNDLAAVLKERAKAEDRSDREPDSARPPKDGNNP